MPDPIGLQSITSSHVLLVEGMDEVNFFGMLLRSIMPVSHIDIRQVGGKDQFKNKLSTLTKSTDWRKVRKVAIIRDADDDFARSYQSIIDSLKSAGLSAPLHTGEFTAVEPQVGLFLMPNNANSGALEDLCLQSISSKPVFKCVADFTACLSRIKSHPRNRSKSQVLTYLSAMPEPCPNLGIAALKGYWDFGSQEFSDLKAFFQDFLSDT